MQIFCSAGFKLQLFMFSLFIKKLDLISLDRHLVWFRFFLQWTHYKGRSSLHTWRNFLWKEKLTAVPQRQTNRQPGACYTLHSLQDTSTRCFSTQACFQMLAAVLPQMESSDGWWTAEQRQCFQKLLHQEAKVNVSVLPWVSALANRFFPSSFFPPLPPLLYLANKDKNTLIRLPGIIWRSHVIGSRATNCPAGDPSPRRHHRVVNVQ